LQKASNVNKTCQLKTGFGIPVMQVIEPHLKSIMMNQMTDASTNPGLKLHILFLDKDYPNLNFSLNK
jgi:hypothetical protein